MDVVCFLEVEQYSNTQIYSHTSYKSVLTHHHHHRDHHHLLHLLHLLQLLMSFPSYSKHIQFEEKHCMQEPIELSRGHLF